MNGQSAPLAVNSRRFLGGCASGLRERTALVDVAVRGDLSRFDAAAAERIRAGVRRLSPQDPLPLVRQADWPGEFLLSSPEPGARTAELLGCWAVALTVAVQRWGRDTVWRGRVVEAGPESVLLAIPWRRQKFFDDALHLSLELLSDWVWSGADADSAPILSNHFGTRWRSLQGGGLPPATLRFIQSAVSRGMPFDVLPSCVQIGWGANAERFDMSYTGASSWIGNSIALNKWKANQLFRRHLIPVPNARLVGDAVRAQQAAAELGWPVVVKPLTTDGGLGVTAGIADVDELNRAFDQAAKLTPGNVVLESHITGQDHRLLIVDGVLVSAVRCTSDGVADVTDAVHPENAMLAQRVARLVGLDLAGVDLITPDIGRSWRRGGLAVCEVNSKPRLAEHSRADRDRDLEGEILEIRFHLEGRRARIPTVAVTGGEHAGPSAELLQRIWTEAGVPAGVCTTRGLRIGIDTYSTEDMSGLAGVRAIFIDPDMRAAALEVLPRQLAADGHPCGSYGIAALLEVLDGEPEAEVVERAQEAVVFNADDPACLALRARARTPRHLLVAAAADNAAVADHLRGGGEAVWGDGHGQIVTTVGGAETVVMPWSGDRPTLFAAALALANGIGAEIICRTMRAGTP